MFPPLDLALVCPHAAMITFDRASILPKILATGILDRRYYFTNERLY